MHFSVGLCAHDKNVIKNKINSKSIFKKKKSEIFVLKLQEDKILKKPASTKKKISSNKVYKVL